MTKQAGAPFSERQAGADRKAEHSTQLVAACLVKEILGADERAGPMPDEALRLAGDFRLSECYSRDELALFISLVVHRVGIECDNNLC